MVKKQCIHAFCMKKASERAPFCIKRGVDYKLDACEDDTALDVEDAAEDVDDDIVDDTTEEDDEEVEDDERLERLSSRFSNFVSIFRMRRLSFSVRRSILFSIFMALRIVIWERRHKTNAGPTLPSHSFLIFTFVLEADNVRASIFFVTNSRRQMRRASSVLSIHGIVTEEVELDVDETEADVPDEAEDDVSSARAGNAATNILRPTMTEAVFFIGRKRENKRHRYPTMNHLYTTRISYFFR